MPEEAAQGFSQDEGPGNNPVLRIPMASVDPSRMIVAGNKGLQEYEILIAGTVNGCEVSCNGGPFRKS